MASPLYDELADVAVEMLVEFGQPIVLTRPASGSETYDPNTGGVVGGGPSAHNGTGLVLDYDQRLVDGTNIRAGDRRVLIAPNLAVTPKSGDTLALEDGTVLKVVGCKPLNPAGVIVLHDVQLRSLGAI